VVGATGGQLQGEENDDVRWFVEGRTRWFAALCGLRVESAGNGGRAARRAERGEERRGARGAGAGGEEAKRGDEMKREARSVETAQGRGRENER